MRSSYRELLKLNYKIALSNEKKKNLGNYSKVLFNKSQIVRFVSLNGRIS